MLPTLRRPIMLFYRHYGDRWIKGTRVGPPNILTINNCIGGWESADLLAEIESNYAFELNKIEKSILKLQNILN